MLANILVESMSQVPEAYLQDQVSVLGGTPVTKLKLLERKVCNGKCWHC